MVTPFLVFLVSYLWHGLGITVGYHRLLAHRSFRCPKVVEYFFTLGGYFAFQGSPIWWSAIHRVHHQNADTAEDIHSPHDGKFHSYAGWMFDDLNIPVEKLCPDLFADPIYAFLDRIDEQWKVILNIVARAIAVPIFGWQLVLAEFIAAILVSQIPLLLNLGCHLPKLGYKNFRSSDNAVNVWWIGLLALGEGWHNNHHVHPGSPRMGLRFFELDLSWLVITSLHKLGLVQQVNAIPLLPSESGARHPLRPLSQVRRQTESLARVKETVKTGRNS